MSGLVRKGQSPEGTRTDRIEGRGRRGGIPAVGCPGDCGLSHPSSRPSPHRRGKIGGALRPVALARPRARTRPAIPNVSRPVVKNAQN